MERSQNKYDTQRKDFLNTEWQSSISEDRDGKPLCSWYDAAQEHFVALLSTDNIWTSTSSMGKTFTAVRHVYQMLSIPKTKTNPPSLASTSSSSCSISQLADEDVIHEQRLTASMPINVTLPIFHSVPNNTLLNNVPILVKFSLDQELVAVQMSETELRVMEVGFPESSQSPHRQTNSARSLLQWTIDLTYSSHAYSSFSPPTARAPASNSSSAYTTDTEDEATAMSYSRLIMSQGERILPGGILWSDHGGNSQDLVIITTLAIRLYKVSLSRSQLAKSRTMKHPMDCFWYECQSRALVTGTAVESMERGSRAPPQIGMLLRTYFLRFSSNHEIEPSELLPSQTPYKFRLELPPPTRLPHFVLWKKGDKTTPVEQLSSDMTIVNLYGQAYCVLIGDEDVKLFHLDKVGKRIKIAKTYLRMVSGRPIVSVVDNVLCLHFSVEEISFLYDIHIEGNQPISQAGTDAFLKISHHTNIYKEGFAFLYPNFLLNLGDMGKLFRLSLNLKVVCDKITIFRTGTENVRLMFHFLLRRKECTFTARRLALEEVKAFLETGVLADPKLDVWMDTFVNTYQSELYPRDCESDCLFFPALGLINSEKLEIESLLDPSCPVPDIFFQRLLLVPLLQSELVAHVLLPLAAKAEQDSDRDRIASVTMLFIEKLWLHERPVNPLIIGLAVALCWKLGWTESAEGLVSNFSSGVIQFQSQWNEMGPNQDREWLQSAAVSLARFLFLNVLCEGGNEYDRSRRLIQGYIRDMLCAVSALTTIASFQLSQGLIMEAISTCLCVKSDYSTSKSIFRPSPEVDAVEFFKCAVQVARARSEIGDRVTLFYHLHSFIKQWDPASLGAQTDSNANISRLAKQFGHEFPEDLFTCPEEPSLCNLLRRMFGF